MNSEGMLNAPGSAPEKLRGRTAVISGEGYGTGAAVARLFREHGVRVAMIGSDGLALESAVPKHCPHSLGYFGDARSVRDMEDFHRQILARFGKADILVVNAGGSVSIQGVISGRYPEFQAKDAFHAVRIGLPFLADGASIVLTTPCLADAGALGVSAQEACKQAMRNFVRVFSNECSRQGIRVNAVVPSRAAMAAVYGQACALITEAIQDMARAALFLASDESRSINGEEIFTGRAAGMPGEGIGEGSKSGNGVGS